MRILFVCLGNICRSPTAEAVMKDLTAQAGLADEITIDSAGTGDWHVGHPPDPRAVEAGARRGLEVGGSARQVAPSDFENFDLIVAMDRSNHADLIELAGREDPHIRLLREFGGDEDLDVPDPYFGGEDGFDEAIELIDRNCRALLEAVRPDRTRGTRGPGPLR
jgi:protein-tyrosine phosphatase